MADEIRQRLSTVAPPPPTGNPLVDQLNTSLSRFPLTTSFVYLYHNPLYAGVVFAAMTAAGISPPVDLGIAFVLNGALRRPRIPFILALSAGVVRLAPSLARLRISLLVTAPFSSAWPTSTGGGAAAGATAHASDGAAAQAAAAAAATPGDAALPPGLPTTSAPTGGPAQPPTGLAARAFARLRAFVLDALNPFTGRLSILMDRYGLAYVLVARALSTACLLGISAALYYGVDISPLLAWVGSNGEAIAGELVARLAVVCM
jgi:hypothetical protein